MKYIHTLYISKLFDENKNFYGFLQVNFYLVEIIIATSDNVSHFQCKIQIICFHFHPQEQINYTNQFARENTFFQNVFTTINNRFGEDN